MQHEVRNRKKRIWLALVLGLLASFGPLTIDMYLPAFPSIAKDFHTAISNVQLSLTACLLGLAIGQLFVGTLSDIYGRRKPLLAGLVIYVIVSFFCAFAPSIGALIIFRFLQGVSGAAGIVIARAIVRDLYSGPQLTKFFSLLMLFSGSAPILAPIIGGQVLRFTSWPGIFIVLSVLGFAMMITVLFGLKETLPVTHRAIGGLKTTLLTYGQLFRDRIFIGHAIAQGFVYAALFAYISGSPFVLQNIYGLTPQQFSLFFAINGLGIIIATQTTGRLAGKIKESKMLQFGLGLASVNSFILLIVMLLDVGLIAILIPLFFVVASVGIVGTTCFSLAMQNQGQSAGRAAALLGVLSFIFGGIAAPFVGVVGINTPLPMGLTIAVCNVGAVISYFILVIRKKNLSAKKVA